jgi:hypothetical protein
MSKLLTDGIIIQCSILKLSLLGFQKQESAVFYFIVPGNFISVGGYCSKGLINPPIYFIHVNYFEF